MKIVLATGIYPPDIGGPATYVAALASELAVRKHDVTVVTYGRRGSEARKSEKGVKLIVVPNHGGILARWFRYKNALRLHAASADRVIAFSSVSVGIPFVLASLQKPKTFLRLGGEFFWERATDAGSMKTLQAWHRSRIGFWRVMHSCFMEAILTSFDGIVYSTDFQKKIHETSLKNLPPLHVIENAMPKNIVEKHDLHDPMRLLFMGRFVRFKNITVLLEAVSKFPESTLTLVGDGPMKKKLESLALSFGLADRVTFLPPLHGDAKKKLFLDHDLLIIPSITEISPNTALEARSTGLPVLLTEHTGLSPLLSKGIMIGSMESSVQLLGLIMKVRAEYTALAATLPATRSFSQIADEWITLLAS